MSLSEYLRALRDNHAVGVSETSSYGVLQALLNGVGSELRPSPVRCILHPSSQGAGIPDGGLFVREQLQPLGREFSPQTALEMIPARGAIEVKGTGANMEKLLASKQVATYLAKYRKVLCTNYREFAVVELQGEAAHTLETFSFASSEAAFWAATADVNGFVAQHGESFRAFLERALLYGAPLATPEALAAFMASCAREAKVRVDRADVPALDRVRSSLEAALNTSFQGAQADAFFRSSLVQTLFYGVFSAWVLWCRENPIGTSEKFNWRLSVDYLHVPVLQSLFHEFSNRQTLRLLDVVEPLEWVTDALNRVDRASFETRFSDGTAVQYFYEPFLEAFDPTLREQLGVWYTPLSVVQYMVARVDEVLKSELGIADGLADPQVVILDPCCGTGAFLVETIRHIDASLKAKNSNDALGASDLKSAVMGRLFGFELLTAPFVVAHLQLGLLMQTLGAPLKEDERAQIFLTNALTGWSEPDGEQLKIDLPGLAEETEAAAHVKRQEKILVILGNPPYSGYAGIAIGEERELTESYRVSKTPDLAQPEGQGLNELYVRFFRMAERKITQGTGRGVVCYISNYSWLDGKSHPAMREAYLSRFSQIWIDNLNGDRYRTGKTTPEGLPDPSIFSTPSNREGIQVGTAIALMVKKPGDDGEKVLHYRDLWGAAKHAQLEAETHGQAAQYQSIAPPLGLGLPFTPTTTNVDYPTWPRLPELFPTSFPGVKTSRDEFVVDIDRDRLETRLRSYFDGEISAAQMSNIAPVAMKTTARFDAKATRKYLQERGMLADNIVRYCYRPFDVRWLYWEPETKLLDEKRTDYWPHVFAGNLWMAAVSQNRRQFDPPAATPELCAGHVIERGVNIFPPYLRDQANTSLFAEFGHEAIKANLSNLAREYLEAIALADDAKTLFLHALAIQHAPRYRSDNADALRLDWPRIPLAVLPNAEAEDLSAEAIAALDDDAREAWDEVKSEDEQNLAHLRQKLLDSGALGETISALLDVSQPLAGVTSGTVRKYLQPLGPICKVGGGALDVQAGTLALGFNWGYRANGAVMPGSGRSIERDWTPDERQALHSDLQVLAGADVLELLGHNAIDVYVNENVFWSGVPAKVWEYSMGGYRVLKKWLSYRDAGVLGRDLTTGEAREFTAIVRRIASLLLLAPQLDANYLACSADGEIVLRDDRQNQIDIN